jgi:hypothetical protein
MDGESGKLRDIVANKDKAMGKFPVLISEHAKIEELGLDFSSLDVLDLLPVAILCGISILFIALWLLAVWEYLHLRSSRRRATNGLKTTPVHDTDRIVRS